MMRLFTIIAGIAVVISGMSFGASCAEETKTQGADKYPNKPITFIMPYEAGTGADILTRALTDAASKKLGVPILVVNKPGAAGVIGLNAFFAAKPDGYTLGHHGTLELNKMQGLYDKDYNDVAMVGFFNTTPIVIVSTTQKPWKTLKEVVDYAKQKPEEVRLATASKGALYWLAATAFSDVAGIKLNIMPMAGAGQLAVTLVAGGHAEIAVVGFPEARPLIDAGNLRLLGVMYPERLYGKYSDAPTLNEIGYNLNDFPPGPRCIFVRKETPKPIIEKLQKVFGEVALSKEYKDFSAAQSGVAVWLPGEQAFKTWDKRRDILRPILQKQGLLKEAITK